MSVIQLLTTFSGSNLNWIEYQMGESNATNASYDGNIIVPINFPIPTTFDIYFDRKVGSHTGTLGYYVDGQLNTNAIWSGIGNFKVRTININSWSGISNIQFRSAINDSDQQSSSPSEWKVYANGTLVYYHSYDEAT
jgi:hypothetical protein